MNKIFIKSLCSFILLINLSACEEESNLQIEANAVVVEAYLFESHPLDSLRVTQSISSTSTDDDIITLDDLSILISDGTDDYLLENIGGGYYRNTALTITADKNYSMEFEQDDLVVTAETYVPAAKEAAISVATIELEKIELGTFGMPTPTDPIVVDWDNTEGDYFYVVVRNIETEQEFINENLAEMERGFARITEPQIIDSYDIDTRRDIRYFGTHQVIVYRVNPEYAALYETSGTTSSSLAEPPTNIVNGLGILTGVSSDTVYFEVEGL